LLPLPNERVVYGWEHLVPIDLPNRQNRGQGRLTTSLPPLLSQSDWANSKAIAGYPLETLMAEHNEVAYTTADGNDYPAHEQTYEGFIKLVKYGTGSVILIVALMAIFLT
jgi:hypothetical protein